MNQNCSKKKKRKKNRKKERKEEREKEIVAIYRVIRATLLFGRDCHNCISKVTSTMVALSILCIKSDRFQKVAIFVLFFFYTWRKSCTRHPAHVTELGSVGFLPTKTSTVACIVYRRMYLLAYPTRYERS